MIRSTDSFLWEVPDFYNIGVDICDKWARERNCTALIYEDHKGQVTKYSFSDLRKLSNQLANGLKAHGIKRGDRVGILLGQSPETAISHIVLIQDRRHCNTSLHAFWYRRIGISIVKQRRQRHHYGRGEFPKDRGKSGIACRN